MSDEGGRPVLGGMEEGRGVKRPFFTSPEDLLEEEYYDEQLPEKKRRLTPEQVINFGASVVKMVLCSSELILTVHARHAYVYRSTCWRGASRRRTSWSRRGRRSWPASSGCSHGRWPSGSRTAAPGGRQRRSSATSTASRRPSTPSAPTTTPSSRTTTGSGHR